MVVEAVEAAAAAAAAVVARAAALARQQVTALSPTSSPLTVGQVLTCIHRVRRPDPAHTDARVRLQQPEHDCPVESL